MSSYLKSLYNTYFTPASKRVVYVHKTPSLLSAADRLSMSSAFFDSVPASSISLVSTSHDCAQPTRESAAFFNELELLMKPQGGEDKDSASASVVFAAIIRNSPTKKRIFVKVAFGATHDLLYYERLIYCQVTQPLLLRRITPCVVPFLGYVLIRGVFNKCGSPGGRLSANVRAICAAATSKGSEIEPKQLSSAHALITEAAGGQKLYENSKGWAMTPRSEDEWRDVWFQVVYTLAVFGEIGLTHFDLHCGNVFVDELSRPVPRVWLVSPGKFRLMHSSWLPKLYDFDRSYKVASNEAGFEAPIANKALSTNGWERIYGDAQSQSRFDPRIDYAKVSSFLGDRLDLLPPRFGAALASFTDLPRLAAVDANGYLSFTGILCYRAYNAQKGKFDKWGPCVIDPNKSADFCSTPAEILAARSQAAADLVGELVDENAARYFMQQHGGISEDSVFCMPSLQRERLEFLRNSGLSASPVAASRLSPPTKLPGSFNFSNFSRPESKPPKASASRKPSAAMTRKSPPTRRRDYKQPAAESRAREARAAAMERSRAVSRSYNLRSRRVSQQK